MSEITESEIRNSKFFWDMRASADANIEFLSAESFSYILKAAIKHGLVQPVPQWITNDLGALPALGKTVLCRDLNGREFLGFRDGAYPDGWSWNEGISASWDKDTQDLEFYDCEEYAIGITHWRPIR